MENWRWMKINELSAGLDSGEISAIDLTECYIDAIERSDIASDIFSTFCCERARTEAKASAKRAQSATRLSPIDGIPLAWKDNIDSAGDLTEASSDLLNGRTPGADADVLAKASAAGAVCIGKTHMSELAFSGLGINPRRATAPHPDIDGLAPGGSSSGSASVVRFGFAAGAIGTDTGGSIRIPASWQNLVGFKPATGALSMKGIVPLAQSFDMAGPMARSIEDAEIIFSALGGKIGAPGPETHRILVLEGLPLSEVEPEIMANFTAIIAELADQGYDIHHVTIPEIEEIFEHVGPLTTYEAWQNWGEAIKAYPERIWERIRHRFELGAEISNPQKHYQALRTLRLKMHQRFSDFDAMLMPTVAIRPPAIQALEQDEETYTTTNLLALRNTRIGNFLGMNSITIPTKLAHSGLCITTAHSPHAIFKLARIITSL